MGYFKEKIAKLDDDKKRILLLEVSRRAFDLETTVEFLDEVIEPLLELYNKNEKFLGLDKLDFKSVGEPPTKEVIEKKY